MNSTTSRKILTRERLRERIEQWRSAGETITLANGCFDLLHVGHIRYLDAARQLGGKLVVAVNSDESVRALKGEGRPLMPAAERAAMFAGIYPARSSRIDGPEGHCQSK